MSYISKPLPIVGISKSIVRTHRKGRFLQLIKKRNLFQTILLKFLQKKHRLLCSYVGCYVPFSAKICRGLVLPHGFYGVFLSKRSKINFGVTILHQVTIGSNPLSSSNMAPVIGSYCFIGAGAKVVGNVNVGSQSVIGVNQVVTAKSTFQLKM
ncbi:MAG: hypothetical protein GJ680_00060 [Alteromonadaceae bacterium]|nr:hypothetical protein [Alteromonadaceae bacterium]